jgi:hypothetical protein
MPSQSKTRARRQDSLATVIAGILEDFQVPLPNEVVRITAEERRGQTVSPEQLARVFSYERDNYLRIRLPPLLCTAIDRRALPTKPRLWALGTWRLARRIATPDVHDFWQAARAENLCNEVAHRFPVASERLQQLAVEAVARVLGPVAAYLPAEPGQWEAFRREVRATVHDPDPYGYTTQQREAEEALTSQEPHIPPASLYFGAELGVLRHVPSAPTKLRLPAEGEKGDPFDQVVRRRLGGDEGRARDLLAYLQGWSHIRDELGRPPTGQEFAEYWHHDLKSVRQDEDLFAQAFPEEDGPERIIALLDEGLPSSGQLAWMMGIEVIDSDEDQRVLPPAPGQRWRRRDGATLTISQVDGPAVIGHLHEHERTSIWAGDRSKLLAEFALDLPLDIWVVTFDVDVLPQDLLNSLMSRGIIVTRFRRPSDPHPDQRRLHVGTIQGQVVAEDEAAARQKVVDALRNQTDLHQTDLLPGKIHVQPFAQ